MERQSSAIEGSRDARPLARPPTRTASDSISSLSSFGERRFATRDNRRETKMGAGRGRREDVALCLPSRRENAQKDSKESKSSSSRRWNRRSAKAFSSRSGRRADGSRPRHAPPEGPSISLFADLAAHAASYTYNNSGTNSSQVKPRLRREGESEREREREGERENEDVENVFDFSDAILSRRRREYLYRFLRSIRAIRRSTTRGEEGDEEEEGGTMPRQKTRGRLLRFPRGPSLL